MNGTVATLRGQAAVETALVLPLTTFLILGVMQLSLLTQSRAVVKYAAYRAARAGALHNACIGKMEQAARAALVPLVSVNDKLLRTTDAASYMTSYALTLPNLHIPDAVLPIVEVRICGPLRNFLDSSPTFNPQGGGEEVDFDDLWNTEVGTVGDPKLEVRSFERTRLRVQVKFNQKMIIPFANALIFQIWSGQQLYSSVMTAGPTKTDSWEGGQAHTADVGTANEGRALAQGSGAYRALAAVGRYYLPIYANYAFRMQSNFFLNQCPLPTRNDCFHYRSGNAGDP